MIKVKIFGLLRMDTGLKELWLEGEKVKDLYPRILAEAKKQNPGTKIGAKDIDGCIIMINGVQGKKSSTLCDGDTVMLMSPVCGG